MPIKCKFQSGVGGFRAADSRMNVTSYWTLTLSEIRPDNMYQPLCNIIKTKYCKQNKYNRK
jgi:hypothetical protein